ncbi:MFS transporter [Staphylococcus saccharolyticus]|uniref:MFS transporter n=1 Tax=Staphylococcus saccharolyticus TaxID=33028 RepID=UPI00102D83F9|nr:MFS transporter [Staphylococcus saccharolyticus]MBL7573862.1 MFS transporter [Staphylococcus saccharolyticus]MBL7639213.1 MFS transporter [Staphylococcus saccharolyticus]QRJ68537.1 MFS transporter [Staphylococcus saccharolyticus]TAA91856.1 MFS transporter [Staphylococcus saccharolyticus]TAA92558.1 MFS transporter [Staphylococcus saccharolyticus]
MKESKNYNLITTIMFLSGIIVMGSLYTALPLTAAFAEDFHVPESIAILNGVIFSLTYSLSCLFYGTISEKFGRIKTILVGMSALVVICLVMGFVHSFIILLIMRALQGVFTASFSPVAMTYTTETYPPVKRVTAISFISTSFMLSGVLGQNMSEMIVSHFNWQWVYFILTLLYLILSFVILKNVPESPHKNPDIKLLKFFNNFKDFKENLKVFYCLFISLTLLIMFISMYSILSSYITSSQVGGDKSAASIVKLFGVVGMLLSLLAGRLSSRLGMKRVLSIALATSVVSLILIGTFTNIVVITIFSVTFVAGIAFSIPTVISKIGDVVNSNQGFFLSVNTVILFLGTAIAPILMIYVEQLTNFFIQFAVIALIGLMSLIVSFFMPSDQCSY